ncbi:hypothetical protein QOZ80_8BG0651610 [Eleusine coracana subsp. coracana]|nr:hypothetical protein QOZ80_8BG0651610 [Eleusine coracana subsp. coracana]
MANLTQAGLCSVLQSAPRRHALVLEAALFVPDRQVQQNRRKPPFVTVACSAKHADSSHFVGTRPVASCSDYVEGTLARGNTKTTNMEREARIRNYFKMENREYFPSSYDTAWVAMVPLPGANPEAPCFPQTVEWIVQNQHENGSWCADEFGLSINKEILMSTLACVIALKKWNVGSEHIKRGLQFVAKNFSVILDEQVDGASVGFNLTVPALFSLANSMDLGCPATEITIDWILLGELEQKRLAGEQCWTKDAYLSYIAQGLVSPLDWNAVVKLQRKNGSLFNSPATTAAALVHHYDDKALNYLHCVVNIFGSAVPALYPPNIYSKLSMVDILEKVGISRHFRSEINSILDKAYMLWSQRDEEVMLDLATCAMAFRLLRMNGYDVSSEELSHVAEASAFSSSVEGYMDDTETILEMYKASEVCLSGNEPILEKVGSWTGSLLNEMLSSESMQRRRLFREVERALKFPFYATVDPLEHKKNIENFDVRASQILKAKNLPCHVCQDILALAIEDFSHSQSVYQAELQQLKSWEKENKLDQPQFIRKILTNSYLAAVATINEHELTDARIACAKSIALTLAADDLFDVEGSKEELENLIYLVKKWDRHHEVEFYSEHVKILFSAIYSTVNQLGAKASLVQNRDVTKYVVESWIYYLSSLSAEAEWRRNKYVPTMEEYLTNAVVGYGLGPITLMLLYFLGRCPWEDIIEGPEYSELLRLSSLCGRLMNDSQTFERECKDGKLNSVSLLVLESGVLFPHQAGRSHGGFTRQVMYSTVKAMNIHRLRKCWQH